jgi:DNA-binding transcriptional LysR family regulator
VKTELELRQLRVFAAVVDASGHTRAARSLGLSQSTVSETLAALERTLGTALFRKSGRGTALTPAGEALLPYARRMLALASELVAEQAKVSADVSATLVVAAVESLSAYVLPERLAALRARWPKSRVEVVTAVCAEIRESVASAKCDLGLLLEAEGASADGEVLARARLVIVCPPDHPLGRGTGAPRALDGRDFYMSDAAGNYHQVLRQYFEGAGVSPPRTQSLGSVEGVKRGILAGGAALGLLPAHAVEKELRDGALAEVRVRPALPGLVLRAVRPPGNGSAPLVDDLVESLRGSPADGLRLTVAAGRDGRRRPG